jgi:hypothetical protein
MSFVFLTLFVVGTLGLHAIDKRRRSLEALKAARVRVGPRR